MVDAEQGKVAADHLHHCGDGFGAEGDEPFAFGCAYELVAIFGGQRLADGDQIVPGIEAFRDRADILAQRLAVADMG